LVGWTEAAKDKGPHIHSSWSVILWSSAHTKKKWAGTFQETGAGSKLIKHIHEQVYVELYFCH
jgi:hypothetical protein